MSRRAGGRVAWVFLGLVYAASVLAGFLAPYDPVEQNRTLAFAPPSRLHVVDDTGRLHLRPFVYARVPRPGTFDMYDEDRTRQYPIRFLPQGSAYRLVGLIPASHHAFGVDEPARVFVMGSDEYGRDVFSRLISGAQISPVAGLLAASLAVAVGLIVGGIAGFYGGVTDQLLTRVAELVMAVPWLYFLLAIRAALPLALEPSDAFLLVVIVIGLVGWARPSRLVRSVVVSARTREYVLAARSFGASDARVLRRHVLPEALGVALTQLALLVPQCILAEVTLSFFGLGVGEPVPSWGTMLSGVQRFHVLASYWWMFLPGLALVPVFLIYYAVTDVLYRHLVLRSP
jgi:peptide/nickel transport system permease protein